MIFDFVLLKLRSSGVQSLGLIATVLLSYLFPAPAQAETVLQCEAPAGLGATLLNQASYAYRDPSSSQFTGSTEQVVGQITTGGALSIIAQGVRDRESNLVYGVGVSGSELSSQLIALGWSEQDAMLGSMAAIKTYAVLATDTSLQLAIAQVKAAMVEAVPNQAAAINALGDELVLALLGLGSSSLQSIGLEATEAQNVATAVTGILGSLSNSGVELVRDNAFQTAIATVPVKAPMLTAAQQAMKTELQEVRDRAFEGFKKGDTLRFEFVLSNPGTALVTVQLPTIEAIQQSGLLGSATVTDVRFDINGQTAASAQLQPQEQIKLIVDTQLGDISENGSMVNLAFRSPCGGGISTNAQQSQVILTTVDTPLIDPFGRITGCEGEILSDYRGFSVALYRPAAGDNTGEIRGLLPLVTTELPDIANNDVPAGLEPNIDNSNPFFLTNGDEGKYNFLLSRNQMRSGQTYILVVKPPEDSNYDERRIRLEIGERTETGYVYRATALDGRPIGADDRRTTVTGTLRISNAEGIGLVLALVDLDTSVCQSEAIQIVKTGDRATAEPGDTVIYRLLVRNLSTTTIENLTITDQLPLGFEFVEEAVRGEMADRSVNITTEQDGSTVTFQVAASLPPREVVSIAYAAQLSPDSLRGTGENSAVARGRRDDNEWVVRDGPAVHRLRIEPGIIQDCGTIIGRVFEDKNFDGEQQPGEPGIPNAVIFMDDGNRITTDDEGLFSVANVLPGYRTGALDLTSVPGYAIAPNTRFIERNSSSRLVQLEPGGLVRMNFAVTPVADRQIDTTTDPPDNPPDDPSDAPVETPTLEAPSEEVEE